MLIQLMLDSSRSKVKSSLSTKLTKFSGHVWLRSKTWYKIIHWEKEDFVNLFNLFFDLTIST